MAVKVVDGDLFTTDARYICHQVNCQGKMGSGIAKVVRSRFPEAFEQYKKACEKGACLGLTQYVLPNGKVIINMFAQDKYGYDKARYTEPYKIGCGLGGGDWETIYNMIDRELGQNYTVELWRL